MERTLTNLQDKTEAISITADVPVVDRLRYGRGILPSTKGPLDALFVAWLRYGRACYNAQDLHIGLSDVELKWWKDVCNRLAALVDDTLPPDLQCLSKMRNHDVTGVDIAKAFQEFLFEKRQRSIASSKRSAAETFDFPGFKAFGLSDAQGAADWDDGAHILLFQIVDAMGPRFADIDLALQIWIKPGDLANGRFGEIGVCTPLAD